MKKATALWLALLLVLSLLLSACGTADKGTTTTVDNTDTTTTVGDFNPTGEDADPTDGETDPTEGDTDDASNPVNGGNNTSTNADQPMGETTLGGNKPTENQGTTVANNQGNNGQLVVGNKTNKDEGSKTITSANNGKTTSTSKTTKTNKTNKTTTTTAPKTEATASTRPPAPDASNFEDVNYVIRQEALDLRLTQEVLDRSVLYEGDMARVATFLKKAMRKEKVVIGFIGGSITQGSSASNNKNKYAERFITWFKATFPNTPVEYVNAGLGATDSLMGVHRVENDLLKYDPDLVFVEFTVNDPDTTQYRDSYEGLMRKILKTDAAVIAIQMMNQSGTNTARQHSPVVRNYDIPTISYKWALWPNSATKVYQWSEISPDSIHPNDKGHAIVCELLIHYINTVRAQITKAPAPVTTLPAAVTDNSYENAVLLNATNTTPSNLGGFAKKADTPQFPNGWYTSNGNNKTFTIEVTDCKNLSLLYWKQAGVSGTAIVKVDGKAIDTVQSDNSVSWNYAQTLDLIKGKTAGKHTIEITCTGTFWILGILKS